MGLELGTPGSAVRYATESTMEHGKIQNYRTCQYHVIQTFEKYSCMFWSEQKNEKKKKKKKYG